MTKEKQNIYLIDGNALCYRAYYAIRELSTSKGRPTNAIYGFINILKKIIREYDPSMMAVVFDTPAPTVRHKRYDEYKIHRKPMPEDLVQQLPDIRAIIDAFNIPVLSKDGYEADDVIATLAEAAKDEGIDVVIVTGDKDAMQLVEKRVKVLSPNTSDYKLYGALEVKEKFGVAPEQMVELMALMGDSSDNVPGVKGVGKVTAEKLITAYETLEGVYKHLDEVSSASLKKKLEEDKEMAELSKELVILDRKVPIKFDLKEMAMSEPDAEKLVKLYKEFEFNKLLKDVAPVKKEKCEYSAAGENDISKVVSAVKKSGIFAFCSVKGSESGSLAGIAVSVEKGKGFFISGENGAITELLTDSKVQKVGFDVKHEIRLLRLSGIELEGPVFEVMLADYLIDPSRPQYDLEGMALRYLDQNMFSAKENVDWDNEGQGTMDFSVSVDIDHYCERADVALQVYPELLEELKKKKLIGLFDDVEIPLVKILADMEDEGVTVDLDFLSKASAKMEKRLKAVTREIYDLADEKFNINSPKQLQVILYEKLGLPALKKTKTGISTDESVLTKLAGMHKLPEMLLEYRSMNKLKTAYYDSILNLADEKGQLHALFNQAVTSTGRLSSSEPNLQNIPIKTVMGQEIRKAFIPSAKDRTLLASDYSQVELRVLAHLSGDARLIKAFKKGDDVHKYTASLIFDCKVSEVTDKMRSAAKTVNFGIVYGISAFGLSKDLGIRIDEAQGFIDAYFKRYSGIKTFIDKTVESARKKGYVTTLLKRRRYIPELNSTNERVRSFAERAAVNTPVQGSAADLIKLAMIECGKEFKNTDVRMILQVHDELVFDIPKGMVSDVAKRVKDIMEGVIELKVPLVVDVEHGANWLEMEEISF